jgi:hypothetical protein
MKILQNSCITQGHLGSTIGLTSYIQMDDFWLVLEKCHLSSFKHLYLTKAGKHSITIVDKKWEFNAKANCLSHIEPHKTVDI